MLFTGICLLCGCNESNSGDSSAIVTDTPIITESTIITTATTTTEISSTTERSTTTIDITTTETPETTAYSNANEYKNSIELHNKDFNTRPVRDNCYNYPDPADVPERERRAIDEGREMYGSFRDHCYCPEKNCLYILLDFGNENDYFSDFSFYRVDLSSGEITFICDGADQNTPRSPKLGAEDVCAMICIGGKPLLLTYSGVYLIDDENCSFTPINKEWEPLGGTAVVSNEKLYMQIPTYVNDSIEVSILVYDPLTNEVTKTDEMPDTQDKLFFIDYAERFENGKATVEGEKGSEEKLVFEWN